MKTLHSTLTVGQEDQGLDLLATLSMDGNVLQQFKCDSFVGNFPHVLSGLFHGGKQVLPLPYASHWSDSPNSTQHPTITGATNATPIRITVDYSNHFDRLIDLEDLVFVYGVQGNTAANGVFKAIRIGEYAVELYDLAGNSVAGNGDYSSGGKLQTLGFRELFVRGYTRRFYEYLAHWQVIVGTGTTPVDVNDHYLASRIQHGSLDGQLAHGNRSISPLTTDKPTSRFTISKSFTNQGATDIVVNEIGIVSQGYDSTYWERAEYPGLLMVRDVLGSALVIPTGKTLTVDYELVIRLSPDTQDTETDGTNGGFLDDFMGAIRDMAIGNNGNQEALFNMASASGHMGGDSTYRDYDSYNYGIRLGTDNTFVSMTDDNCKAPIQHGSAGSQLWYYGMNVESVIRDQANNKAYFEVSRIVENRTANPITVAEISLLGNRRDNSLRDEGFDNPVIYARTALKSTDQITISPGEFAIIKYTIEVIV